MRRFISYIYHYADGTYKCGNVGFCKVEQDGADRTVTLCVKDVKPMEGRCRVYNLSEGGMDGDIGKVYTRHLLEKDLFMSGGKINDKMHLQGGDGLLIQCGNRQYVVLWRNCEETISIVDGDMHMPEQGSESGESNVENIRDERTKRTQEKKQEKTQDRNQDNVQENTGNVASRKDNYEYQRLYNRLCKSRMILEGKEYQVVKLKPQDIMWFPRSHWRLINNCFVMDGYYRYGHILFFVYKGDYVIAVPAVYSRKTPEIAKRFGFPYEICGSEYGREDVKRPYWYKIL